MCNRAWALQKPKWIPRRVIHEESSWSLRSRTPDDHADAGKLAPLTITSVACSVRPTRPPVTPPPELQVVNEPLPTLTPPTTPPTTPPITPSPEPRITIGTDPFRRYVPRGDLGDRESSIVSGAGIARGADEGVDARIADDERHHRAGHRRTVLVHDTARDAKRRHGLQAEDDVLDGFAGRDFDRLGGGLIDCPGSTW